MDNKENNNTQNNQNEQTEEELQGQHNIDSNKRMAQTGLKGAATAAGAFFGGATGAKIGSKAADIVNNTPVGNAITNAAGQVGNAANKMSPTGNINQGLANAAADSGALDLADKGIDAAASSAGGTPSNATSQATSGQGIKTNPKLGTVQPNQQNNPQGNSKLKPNSTPGQNNGRNISASKNPTRASRANISKRHSKHADGSNDARKQEETKSENPLTKRRPFRNNTSNNKEQSPNEEKPKDAKQFGNMMKVLGGFVSSVMGILGAIGTFIMTHIVLISVILLIALLSVFLSLIVSLLVSFFQYAKEDDGTVCYVTPSCNKVVIKGESGDKTYFLDEYIAGAIVNYYDHDSYAVSDADVDQNLLKAFSVIIHSDIAAYSDYDSNNEICTVNDESKFSNIYIPTVVDGESGSNDESSNADADTSTDSDVDGVSGADTSPNTKTDDSTTEDEEIIKKNNYYNQAKTAANSVLSEVVDIYTQRINVFYEGYKDIINTSAAIGNDYKTIIRDYIKGSPDYEEVENDDITSGDNNDADTIDDNNGNPIGIYPVCDFEKANSNDNGTIGTIVMNDLCSQVKVTDKAGNLKGIYSYDEFIEGVLYNEARAWYQSADTMKAHAVAARTWFYNAVKTNFYSSVEGDVCTIASFNKTIGFTQNTIPAIHQAVAETAGEYIIINGKISNEGRWDALAIRDGYYQNKDSKYYTLAQKNQKIPKDWLNEQQKFYSIPEYITMSHGYGMSQYGAYYLATVENKNYKEIINYYYGGEISKVSNGYVMPINTFSSINGEKSVGYCGSGNPHNGLDFGASSGTPVYAATSGVIEKEYSYVYQCYQAKGTTNPHHKDCTKEAENYGDNMAGQGFKIKNDDGTYSLYFHFSKKENLHVGDRVEAGQKIGEVGTTGYSSGPHLHYEMRLTSVGNAVEPRDYLPMEGYSICYNYQR